MESEETEKTMLKHYLTLLLITIFMVGALIFGFFNGGSPGYIRGMAIDQDTISRMTTMSYSVESYISSNYKLPASLEDLEKAYPSYPTGTIPEASKAKIEYKLISNSTYEFCADFHTDNQKTSSSIYPESKKYLHPAGNFCIEFKPSNLNSQPNYYNPSPIPVQNILPPQTPSSTLILDLNKDAANCQYSVTSTNSDPLCTVSVDGRFTIAESYCTGPSGNKIPLTQPSYSTTNVFTATLTGLKADEKISAYVKSQDNSLLTCKKI